MVTMVTTVDRSDRDDYCDSRVLCIVYVLYWCVQHQLTTMLAILVNIDMHSMKGSMGEHNLPFDISREFATNMYLQITL